MNPLSRNPGSPLQYTCVVIVYFSAAVDAFRKFLDNTKSEDIVEVLDNEACWEKFVIVLSLVISVQL